MLEDQVRAVQTILRTHYRRRIGYLDGNGPAREHGRVTHRFTGEWIYVFREGRGNQSFGGNCRLFGWHGRRRRGDRRRAFFDHDNRCLGGARARDRCRRRRRRLILWIDGGGSDIAPVEHVLVAAARAATCSRREQCQQQKYQMAFRHRLFSLLDDFQITTGSGELVGMRRSACPGPRLTISGYVAASTPWVTARANHYWRARTPELAG